jgi:uncharacterized protein YbaP (TraB family)
MKHLFLITLLAIGGTHIAAAQNSILWEVSGKDLKKSSYLMGTLKFIGRKEYYLPKKVKETMDRCEAFAIEDEVDHRSQHELSKAMHLPDGKKLADYMSPADYQALLDLFQKEFKIGQAQFEKAYSNMIPLALSINMTRLSLKEKVKFYDIELLKLAKQKELDAFNLEHIEREAQAIQAYPLADQFKALDNSVKNFALQKKEYLELEAAFVKGDIDLVFIKTLHPTENNPQFIESFYFQRNEEWLPKIEKMMGDQPTFITVGVGHLEGERGLIRLLQKQGYTLTPMMVLLPNSAGK